MDRRHGASDVDLHLLEPAYADVRVVDRRHVARLAAETQMLFAVLYGKNVAPDDVRCWALWTSPSVRRSELEELAPMLRIHNALLEEPHELDADIPLTLHGR